MSVQESEKRVSVSKLSRQKGVVKVAYPSQSMQGGMVVGGVSIDLESLRVEGVTLPG